MNQMTAEAPPALESGQEVRLEEEPAQRVVVFEWDNEDPYSTTPSWMYAG